MSQSTTHELQSRIARCESEADSCLKASGDQGLTIQERTGAMLGHMDWITAKTLYEEDLKGTADLEYASRIEADQCTWQFGDALRPQKPQAAIEDLPLFGGERQSELFEEVKK